MLSNKAMLVTLKISQWAGRKLDKVATNSVEGSFKTQAKVGNYTKKLLPGAGELETVHALAGATRNFYYSQTLPWMADGSRILSAKNYMDFMNEFRKRRKEFDKAVNAFIKVYPSLRTSAETSLGDLFNAREYPSRDALRERFECSIVVLPMPDVGDFRTEVLESEKEEFLNSMRQIEARATQECFGRLQDVVVHAVHKLNQPDAIFRDSLIKNISSICELLPKLNITDDAKLEQMRSETLALVATISPDNCRNSASERASAAAKLAAINDKMGAFMGAG